MTNRIWPILAAGLAVTAAPAFAQDALAPLPQAAEAASPAYDVAEGEVLVRLDTEMGPIVIALDTAHAPITANNFLAYVDKGNMDGEPFYRAMPFGGEGGLVQGGVRDGRKLLPPIEHEPTTKTGLTHKRGTVSMANAGPGTARNDFFILLSDVKSFDAKPGAPGFAPFGRVVEGMDTVEKIFKAPVDPDKGTGAMKGQMIADPVLIVSAERIED